MSLFATSSAGAPDGKGARAGRAVLGLLAAAAVVGALSACEPVRRSHGYAPREEQIAQVRVGVDNQAEVARKLGRPPIVGAFEENAWVYVFRQTESVAFWNQRTTDQQAVVVSFTPAGVVESVERYGLEDGRVINLATRVTPTRGKQLGFLQQLFGNIGRFEGVGGQGAATVRTPGG